MEIVIDCKYLFLLVLVSRPLIPLAQSCTSNLSNTVVYEGSPVSFSRVNNSQLVQWAFISTSDLFNQQKSITNYDDVVVSQFNTTYAVTPSGLTILNATVAPQGSMPYSTAGLYIIRYQNPNCTYGANLIVIRSGPVCSYNASDPNNVRLLCSVDFAESSVQPNNPIFTWKNSTSIVKQVQPIPSQITSNMKRSTSQLSIDRSDVTKYECQLSFNSTPTSPNNYVSRTAPSFTASCFSSRDVSIVPTYGPAAGGTMVTIVAKWMALENISISAVYIGQNLQANITRTSAENVLVTIPAIGNDLQINQPLPVILQISPTSTNITTGKYFTYRPNPRINDTSTTNLPMSVTGSSVSFSLCDPPTLSCEGNIEFDHNFITIQGDKLLSQCLRPSDYTVRIGNGFCTVKNITNSTLTCYPPENKPQQTENDVKSGCGNGFSVIVEIGFKVYSCSCLKYPDDNPTKPIIIIATTVGTFVVVLIIITVIVVAVRRFKNSKKQAPNRESEENQPGEDSYTKLDHRIGTDRQSTHEYDGCISYRRNVDANSTSGGSYTTQLPGMGGSSDPTNQIGEPGDYLSPIEDNYKNVDEMYHYETISD